jgi:hypothetical protein
LARYLHDEYGWKTLYVSSDAKTPPAAKAQAVGYVPYELKGDRRFVKGTDTGIPVDVTLPIDAFMLKGKSGSGGTAFDLKTLSDIPFAVGVAYSSGKAGWGVHTFTLAEGRVFESHWDQGPTSAKLFTYVSLAKFMKEYPTFALVIPPSAR